MRKVIVALATAALVGASAGAHALDSDRYIGVQALVGLDGSVGVGLVVDDGQGIELRGDIHSDGDAHVGLGIVLPENVSDFEASMGGAYSLRSGFVPYLRGSVFIEDEGQYQYTVDAVTYGMYVEETYIGLGLRKYDRDPDADSGTVATRSTRNDGDDGNGGDDDTGDNGDDDATDDNGGGDDGTGGDDGDGGDDSGPTAEQLKNVYTQKNTGKFKYYEGDFRGDGFDPYNGDGSDLPTDPSDWASDLPPWLQ